MLASWLSAHNKVHDIALLKGPDGKLHHFAFQMHDWNEILHAADIFAMDDVPIDVGPTRNARELRPFTGWPRAGDDLPAVCGA